MGTGHLDPTRDAEALVEPEVAAGLELPCVNGWDMRSAEAHRHRRCLVEDDRAGEGTIQEGERAPQRGGLEVELARDAGSLQAHAPDGRGGRVAVSDEQVRDHLGPDGSLRPPLGPPLWGVELGIAHPEVHQRTQSPLPARPSSRCP